MTDEKLIEPKAKAKAKAKAKKPKAKAKAKAKKPKAKAKAKAKAPAKEDSPETPAPKKSDKVIKAVGPLVIKRNTISTDPETAFHVCNLDEHEASTDKSWEVVENADDLKGAHAAIAELREGMRKESKGKNK